MAQSAYLGIGRKISWVFLSQLASLMAALLVGVAVARSLGAAGQGLLSVAFVIPQLMVLGASLGGGATLTYFVSRDQSPESLLAWLGFLGLAVGLMVGIVLWVFPSIQAPVIRAGVSPQWLRAFALWAVFQVWATGLGAILLGLSRVRVFFWVGVAPRLAQGLGLLLLWSMHQWSTEVALALWMGAPLAGVGAGVWGLRRAMRLYWDARFPSKALAYAGRGHFGNVAQFLNYRVALYLIGLYLPLKSAGWYWLAITLSELLWYLPQATASVWMPEVSKNGHSPERTLAYGRGLMGINAALAVVGGTAAWWLLPRIWGTAFSPSLPILWILLPGTVLFTWSKVLAADIAGRGHPEWGTWSSLTGLAVLLTVGLLDIRQGGPKSLALAQALSYLVSTAMLFRGFARVNRINLAWRQVWRISLGDLEPFMPWRRTEVG